MTSIMPDDQPADPEFAMRSSSSGSTRRTRPPSLNFNSVGSEPPEALAPLPEEFGRTTSAVENPKLILHLENVISRCALQPPGLLDRRVRNIHVVAPDSSGTILLSNTPITFGLMKMPLRRVLAIVGAVMILVLILQIIGTIADARYREGEGLFKFIPKSTRDGASSFDSPVIKGFGLLKDGWPIGATVESISGSEITVNYKKAISWNGYYLVLSPDSEKDPIRFSISQSSDGLSWDEIVEQKDDSMKIELPEDRGEVFKRDFRLSRREEISMFALLSVAVGCGSCVRLAYAGKIQLAKTSLVVFWFLSCVLSLFTGDWAVWWSASPERVITFPFVLVSLMVLCISFQLEYRFLEATFLMGFAFAALFLGDLIRNHDPIVDLTSLILIGVFPMVASAIAIFLKSTFLERARRVINVDKGEYNKAAEVLMREHAEELLRLSELCDKMEETVEGPARQLNRVQQSEDLGGDRDSSSMYQNMSVIQRMHMGGTFGRAGPQSPSRTPAPQPGNLLLRVPPRTPVPVPQTPTLGEEVSPSRNVAKSPTRMRKWSSMMQVYNPEDLIEQSIGGIPQTRDEKNPVDSLDQLYFQASCVDFIVKQKVRKWALKSSGLFPTKVGAGESALIRWIEAHTDRSLREEVKWCKVKSPERCIEKVVRCYAGDVSRLVDMARQAIIFDSIEDIRNCLQAIYDDEEIKIDRIKNRLNPKYDAQESGGYRDLNINFRVVNEETTRLALETHVAEVQLIYKEFWLLKSDEGHKRYVKWRNLKAQ